MKTIRELREERGWSQFELAVKVGVTPGTIGYWERGAKEPRVGYVRRLARLFGVSMDDIAIAERVGHREDDREGKRAA